MTEAFFAESHEECLERFRLNQSDFSLNRFSIHDTSGKYSAPVPSYSSSLNAFTLTNRSRRFFRKNMPSVLHNLLLLRWNLLINFPCHAVSIFYHLLQPPHGPTWHFEDPPSVTHVLFHLICHRRASISTKKLYNRETWAIEAFYLRYKQRFAY